MPPRLADHPQDERFTPHRHSHSRTVRPLENYYYYNNTKYRYEGIIIIEIYMVLLVLICKIISRRACYEGIMHDIISAELFNIAPTLTYVYGYKYLRTYN